MRHSGDYSEEETDGEEYAVDNGNAPKDEKDAIIAKQRRMMKEMQKEFAATLDSLRIQLNEYIAQSSQVQNEMVDRIRELKTELAQLRRKSDTATKRTSQVVRSSLYTNGPKHPRKLAQADDVRRSKNRP